jgi:hypothetical protein
LSEAQPARTAVDCPGGEHKEPSAWLARQWRKFCALTRLSQLLIGSIALMCLYVLYAALQDHPWVFNVQAQTQVVEVITPPDREIRWRIDGATVCLRRPLETIAGTTLAVPSDTACGRWQGYRTTDPEQTLILRGAVQATLETHADRTLFLSLRTQKDREATIDEDEPALETGAWLSFTDGTPDIPLAQGDRLRVNLVFPYTGDSTPRGDRVFPFSGDTTLGRDVNWAGSSLLTSGAIQVYTADESPDKRLPVDEAELLLGDQVRLEPRRHKDRYSYPKGFIRLAPGAQQFDVIAFGAADRVRIERFGDNGYNFRPGWYSPLVHDPIFILVATIFIAVISLITSVASVCERKPCA